MFERVCERIENATGVVLSVLLTVCVCGDCTKSHLNGMSTIPFSTGRPGQVREILSGKGEAHWLKEKVRTVAIVRYVLGNLIVMCLFRITSAGCL